MSFFGLYICHDTTCHATRLNFHHNLNQRSIDVKIYHRWRGAWSYWFWVEKYFDNYDTCTPYNNTQNEHSPHKHDDIDMSDLVVSDDVFLEENKLDRSRKFNETISRLFLSLQSL